MKLFIAILLVLTWATVGQTGSLVDPVTHYYNHSVYRLKPNSLYQLNLLHILQDEVDFWREPDHVNHIADVMLTPANKDRLLKYFAANGIEHTLIIPDVEKIIEAERREQRIPKPFASTHDTEAIDGFWNTYQRLAQQVAFVDAIVSANGAIAQKIEFGTSYEGRTLVALKLGVASVTGLVKPVIWIEGGIHAREWISPATVTYFTQQLVNKYNAGDADAVALLGYFDFYIVPVLNVDGYEFSHTTTRLWRKTRRPSSSGSTCIGADPNRNFPNGWGQTGASTNPCSETYMGDSALSEPEVKAEVEYITNNLSGRVKAFLAIHSYGQYYLWPWGVRTALTPDDAEMRRVATISVAALNAVSPNTRYTIGTTANVLYLASGGANDWSYADIGAIYSYTIELRDQGTYGFQLPASQIVPTGEETTPALIALARAVQQALVSKQQQEV